MELWFCIEIDSALVPCIPNRITSWYAFCYVACLCSPVILFGKSCCTQKDLPIRACGVPSENNCVNDDGPCAKVITPRECGISSQLSKIEEFKQQIEVFNPCCGQVYVPVPSKEDLFCQPVEDSEMISTCVEISDECCIKEECSTTERSCSSHHCERKSDKELGQSKKTKYRSIPKKYHQSKTFEYDCQDNELVLKIKKEMVTVNTINDDLKKKESDIPSVLYNSNFLFK